MIGLSPEDSHLFIRRKGETRCGVESQRLVTLNNRVVAAAVGGHPVKGGGRCRGRGTCCVGGGRCGWEPQQVVTLKNRKMWGEARFGRTYCVEVGLPAFTCKII